MKHDLTTVDVIAESETAEKEPPLAFTQWDGSELLDVVGPGAVGGVGLEDVADAIAESTELGVPSKKFTEEPLESRRGANEKKRRHAF
ncbi:hypothetical protein HYW67_00195 [Candidatus Parcubacteria bacterium]|nr:hypothetical protein [Candidatus Parcubacteria bacterium]